MTTRKYGYTQSIQFYELPMNNLTRNLKTGDHFKCHFQYLIALMYEQDRKFKSMTEINEVSPQQI